jgi:hypothetical protein
LTNLSTATSILGSISTSSASNTPYDNGQWHTSNPFWSNSTGTAAPSVPTTPLPTLEPISPVAVIPDSVPGVN